MTRSWVIVLVLGLLLGLLVPGPAWAADSHGEKDLFGRSLDLAIWTWVVFFVLLFVLVIPLVVYNVRSMRKVA